MKLARAPQPAAGISTFARPFKENEHRLLWPTSGHKLACAVWKGIAVQLKWTLSAGPLVPGCWLEAPPLRPP